MATQHGSRGIVTDEIRAENENFGLIFRRGSGSCELGIHTAFDLHAHDSNGFDHSNTHLHASADFSEKSIAQRPLEWSGLAITDLEENVPQD